VERLLAANNMEAPIIARPWGVSAEELRETLLGAGVATHDVPLVPDSLRLESGVSLVELGAFKQGLMFVQDPAATLVTNYAAIDEGSTVADLCAAPGGKTLELSRRAGRVIASDRNRMRVERMLVGLGRLDCGNIEALVADARMPAVTQVDAVLIDVPCTGTGTFRRHPDARWRLRVSDFAVMGALQREILRGAATRVRPGGLLVYSTCSLEPEENDEMVDAFLEANPDFEVEAPPPGVVDASVLDNGRLRVLPQHHGTDGAFAVRMRKRS
jgi:16S rRNA (cytosine967-C5)-methyltransferase